jgi:hypothetical protein
MVVRVLEEFQNVPKTDLTGMRSEAQAYSDVYERILLGDEVPASERDALLGSVTLDNNTSVPQAAVLSGEPTRSLLEIVPPAEEMPARDLESMTKVQLMAMAQERGLRTSGNKAEIIRRLRDAE